jgi:hypothetical protein
MPHHTLTKVSELYYGNIKSKGIYEQAVILWKTALQLELKLDKENGSTELIMV